MARRVMSIEKSDLAIHLYFMGQTCAEVAAVVGCRWNNVRDELKRRGIPARHKNYYESRDAAIRALGGSGWTLDRIASVIAIGSQEHARRILEENTVAS